MSGYQYCRKCHQKTPYPICNDCVAKSTAPCTNCGKPTPTITVYGKAPKRTTCLACTARDTAGTRRIGITCRICHRRFAKVDGIQLICPECLKVTAPCPICHKPMPKYKKKGGKRRFCSRRCTKLANPTTHEQAKKANQTKWAGHEYKSRQNDIARGKAEYAQWRDSVFQRDHYTCQKCGAHNEKGAGETIVLHPHHIKPFATFPELRYEPSNGITLCMSCHRKEHKNIFVGRAKRSSQAYASSRTSGKK